MCVVDTMLRGSRYALRSAARWFLGLKSLPGPGHTHPSTSSGVGPPRAHRGSSRRRGGTAALPDD